MTQVESIIALMKESRNTAEKNSLVDYLINIAQNSSLTKKERDILSTLIEYEAVGLHALFEGASCYKETNTCIGYANALMTLALVLFNDLSRAPKSLLSAFSQITPIIKKARYFEDELDTMMTADTVTKDDVFHLSETLDGITDEYQRGLLWSGILHYEDKFSSLNEEVAHAFHVLFVNEFKRLLSLPRIDDILASIEVAVDALRLSLDGVVVSLLYESLTLGEPGITYYAVNSLLEANAEISPDTVSFLAHDLEYAALTYEALQKHHKESLFPKELATSAYLAKSDLVHWLIYPTELGKMPDEIEYLGCVDVKKIPHYIFRFRSDSDTLDDASKGKWMIGWSAAEGNTFSNFDYYEDYEEKTVQKTLKRIKQELLY